jgi:dolichol-phosphate mannosyltransferase
VQDQLSPPLRTITVVIPVYFNRDSLELLHLRLCEVGDALAARGIAVSMVFVDDGSGDDSFKVLAGLHARDPRVRVVRHVRNFGSFAALKTGIAHAAGDAVVTLSADLQDPPELIIEMAERWLAGERFVIAVRASRDDPASSKLFSTLYYRVLRALVIPDYPAGGFDFMLIDRQVVPFILEGPKGVNLNLYTYWLGFPPSVLSYDRVARQHGRSRWTLSKKVNLFLNTITGFSARPIRLMSLFGLGVAGLGLAYGVYVVLFALVNGSPAPGFPTLAALISLFSGLIIFMLGVIGEYLWRIFDAVNRKPEAVVGEVLG